MWLNRLMMVTLLALITAALYLTGRAMGLEARQMAVGMVFGALAGMPPALLVLFMARRTDQPAPEPEQTWQHEDEDDAPYAAWTPNDRLPRASWPNPVSLVGENEETFDEYQWGVAR